MTTLVVGASGATGRLLVAQLLEQGQSVRIIVRNEKGVPENLLRDENLDVIQASVLDLSDEQLIEYTRDCDALASCLGHNLTFKGLFRAPRRLVTDATRRLCDAAKANNPKAPIKFVLMNTTGNVNRDRNEKVSFAQACVLWLLRLLLPPHADNEQAAEYLRAEIGQDDPFIEWVAVRPDGLTDAGAVTPYTVHPSPTRSAIFDAGQVSRVNVGHFMAELITNQKLWDEWKGEMPVIYSKEITR